MKHTWKKTTAFIMAMALVAGFAPANVGGFLTGGTAIVASAAEQEPADHETITYDGVTYYNTHVDDFTSQRAIMLDFMSAKNPELDGYSMADLWILTACALDSDYSCSSSTANSQMEVLKQALKSTPISGKWNDYYHGNYREAQIGNYKAWVGNLFWEGDEQSGHMECIVSFSRYNGGDYSYDLHIQFKNPRVVALLPSNDEGGKNYVSTQITVPDPNGDSVVENVGKNKSSVPYTFTYEVVNRSESTFSNSTNTTVSAELSATYEVGITTKVGLVEASEKGTFGVKSAFEKSWSESYQQSGSKETKTSTEITLPPYTCLLLKHGKSTTTLKRNYNCPIGLVYDVEFYPVNNNYSGHWFFGGTKANGLDGRADLQKRAINEGYRTDITDREGVKWTTGNKFPNADVKNAIELISSHAPMSTVGATMTESKVSDATSIVVSPISPLWRIEPSISKLDMKIGETSDTKDIKLNGYNSNGGAYYGFNPEYGHWIVVDEDGKEFTNTFDSPVKLTKNALKGLTSFKAVKPGKCYLKYLIDENSYSSSEQIDKSTKNSDLFETAMVEVTVTQIGTDKVYSKQLGDKTVKVRGAFTGTVGYKPEKIEDDGKLEVSFFDDTEMEIEPDDYIWVKQELKGITLDSNGNVQFSKEGTYHVQLRSPDQKTIYSEWIPITAIAAGEPVDEPDEPIPFVDADADSTFEITGGYTGLVGAEPDSIEGGEAQVIYFDDNGVKYGKERLSLTVCDTTGMEINAAHTWEAQETDGITITEDGKVSFNKEGTYHVRVKSGDYYSDWVEITAKPESAEYSAIYFDGTSVNLDPIYNVYGTAITPPADPTMKGYIFKGWSPEFPTTMPADPITLTAQWEIDDSTERVLIKGNVRGAGHLAVSENGDAPVFDEDHPATSLYNNVVKGDTLIYSVKADEGWVFKEWQHKATGEVYSKDATITITADTPLDLVAVFDTEDAVTEHKLTDAEMMQWTAKDYKDKAGTDANVAITGWSDDEYEITITDDDDKVLDTYKINPDTGIGTNEAGEKVNLPQTGMSGAHKALAGLAALMTLTGIALVKKSRKEDED